LGQRLSRILSLIRVKDPLIRAWLARKFDQWADIRPYVVAAHQAAASEPDIQTALDQWFDTAIDDMVAGLDSAAK